MPRSTALAVFVLCVLPTVFACGASAITITHTNLAGQTSKRAWAWAPCGGPAEAHCAAALRHTSRATEGALDKATFNPKTFQEEVKASDAELSTAEDVLQGLGDPQVKRWLGDVYYDQSLNAETYEEYGCKVQYEGAERAVSVDPSSRNSERLAYVKGRCGM